MHIEKQEWYLLQFEIIFNERALKKLRAIKGSQADEAALAKVRWTEKEREGVYNIKRGISV